MKAYIDSNILIDLEQNNISKKKLEENFENKVDTFVYSHAHLFEAYEMSGSKEEISERLTNRFKIITDLTFNNYLSYDVEANTFELLIEEPEPIFNNIPKAQASIDYARRIVNEVTFEQRQAVQKLFDIPSVEFNNFSPEKVIEAIEKRNDLLGGLSLIEVLMEEKERKNPGADLKLNEKIAAMIELLDIYGFWKDRPTHKSNYARTWDGIHIFLSSFCDLFITNDLRTRYKAEVIFKVFDINTKVLNSNGK
jgi:hypothetical protein